MKIMKTLIRPLCSLNLEAAQAGAVWLPRVLVAERLSEYIPAGFSQRELSRLLKWAEGYGLASPDGSRVVFPLRDLLGELDKLPGLDVSTCLEGIIGEGRPAEELLRRGRDHIDRFLSLYAARPHELSVLAMREGLLGHARHTPGACGKSLGISVERVRQILDRMWSEIVRAGRNAGPLTEGFLCLMAGLGGRRLFSADEADAVYGLRFICRALGFPLRRFQALGVEVLQVDESTAKRVLALPRDARCVSAGYAESRLKRLRGLCLSVPDRFTLADLISAKARSRATLGDVVQVALAKIGRPAHYTEISRVCQEICPEMRLGPRRVGSVLGRKPEDIAAGKPWVWTGLRGVYALKDWGYERPAVGLYKAVAEIVTNIYAKTGKPVAMSVVQAEAAKYRRLINPNSLAIACRFNPALRAAGEDRFVPRDGTEAPVAPDSEGLDDLDRKLRRLE